MGVVTRRVGFLLGSAWVVAVAVAGASLGGRPVARMLPRGWLGLDPIVGGAWIGGTINATGAVVAAGESLGKEAGEVAATVKMIQNSMIGIIAFAVAVDWAGWVDHSGGPRRGSLLAEAWRRFPRFILGFLAASIACSWLFNLSPAHPLWVDGPTTGFTSRLRGWLFCSGFVCMGLQTNFRELAPVLASGRPLSHDRPTRDRHGVARRQSRCHVLHRTQPTSAPAELDRRPGRALAVRGGCLAVRPLVFPKSHGTSWGV